MLDAETIQIGSQRRAIDDQIQLHIPDALDLDYGDRIAVSAELTPTSDARDEYLQWLANQRIAASAFARSGSVEPLGPAEIGWRQSLAADARRALNRSLRDALPPPLSGIAPGA